LAVDWFASGGARNREENPLCNRVELVDAPQYRHSFDEWLRNEKRSDMRFQHVFLTNYQSTAEITANLSTYGMERRVVAGC
jgi:hypothetical protein